MPSISAVLLTVLVLGSGCLQLCAAVSEEEKQTLIDIYHATGGPNWDNSTFWLTEADPCLWVGVQCSAGSIQFLLLSQNNLVGPLPIEQLIKLRSMTGFELSGNNLTGTISTLVGQLPPLTDTIVLDANHFTGTIPKEFANLTHLQSLFVDFNNLEGELEPGMFPNSLISLGLSANKLTGQITDDFLASLPVLIDFFLGLNFFDGPLPATPNRWSQRLSVVNMARNNFTGSIPDTWTQLRQVTVLSMEENNIEAEMRGLGELKDSVVSQWTSLENINLSGNLFSGPLPSALGDLSRLVTIMLKDNQFVGQIPAEWQKLQHLEQLILSRNKLSGVLSDLYSFPATRVSQTLGLADNNFEGRMSDVLALAGALGLSQLDVSGNPGLSGTFPSTLSSILQEFNDIFQINGMYSLNVANCSFDGELPEALFRSSFFSLTLLDISNNNFSGPLPTTYMKGSQSLQIMQVGNNPLLKQNGEEGQVAFSDSQVTTFGRVICPSVVFYETDTTGTQNRRQITLSGLDPKYFDFSGCTCAGGFKGRPPNCETDTSRVVILAVSLPMVAIVMGVITTGVLVYRRRRLQRRREKTADKLLGAYAAHQAKKNVAGVQSGSSNGNPLSPTGSGGALTGDTVAMNPLAVAAAFQQAAEAGVTKTSSGTGTSGSRENHTGGSTTEIALSRMFSADSDWVIPYSRIQILRQLASGASGSVSLGLWNHIQVAVKTYHPGIEFDFNDFSTETAVHIKLRHPNVVQLLGVCINPVAVVLEFVARGSLFHILHVDPTSMRVPGRTHALALQIAKGMAFLHIKGIIHRDLKALNILVTEDWTAKVSDFGASRQDAQGPMTMGLGTVRWMAPETMSSREYGLECDIYSYALVLWEMATEGELPYGEIKFDFEVMDKVKEGYRPKLPESCPPEWNKLMSDCWNEKASERPSFEDIIARVSEFTVDMFGNSIAESKI